MRGDLAAYSVSTYSFETHTKTSEIRVLNVNSGQSRLITKEKDASDPNWLNDNDLLWLVPDQNSTKIVIGNAAQSVDHYVATTVPAPISDIRVQKVSEAKYAIAFAAKAKRDGSLFRPQEEQSPHSSAKLYDHVFVRHWDTYVTPNRNAIWHAVLTKENGSAKIGQNTYSLGGLTNVIKGSGLESPIPPWGGSDSFDLGTRGVCFVAKDPELNPAFNTKSNFYHVPIAYENGTPRYAAPIKSSIVGFEGAATSPAFSKDGKKAVYLQMKENGYETDRNRVALLNIAEPDAVFQLTGNDDEKVSWDRSPSSVKFASDSKTLLLTAEEEGNVKLFKLDLPEDLRDLTESPKALTINGSVSNVEDLSPQTPKILVSASSFVDNSYFAILDIQEQSPKPQLVSSGSRNGSIFQLSQKQVSDVWFEGAGDYKVHAWVIKPSNFDAGKKYPLAYLIHGGPQGSWEESWSTRWNPAVFAEQGYIVVAPNPTGSTGYGQGFTDAIKDQWGGRPYDDLVNGFEYIRAKMDFVDVDRAVALGASYGGYMMAWMQGQPLAKEFKAFVCHDGSFNLPGQLSSDEQYFPNHDLGGPPTIDPKAWDEWSPHLYISNWSTPMLIIHNELDYRLPIGEGLAMFNVLQERKVKSRFLTFPNENHWVMKEENSLVWHTVVINWINSFVGLPPYKNETDLGIVIQN